MLKMNFTVYREIWKSHVNNTFDRSITGVRQVDNWNVFGMVVKITCAHLSQKVFATESSEHCTIDEIK